MIPTIAMLPVSPTDLECPFCRAGAGQPCITSGGRWLRNDSLGAALVHVARIKEASHANAKPVGQTHR